MTFRDPKTSNNLQLPAVPYEIPAKTSRFQPKRVAPPPPKNKHKKKAAGSKGDLEVSVVYDEPVSTHWYSRKKRPSKRQYKELNLKQVQTPNQYSKPQDNT